MVTGGGGYIGSHAVKKLLRLGLRVVVFDNFSRGYREPLEIISKYGDLTVVEGDLRNKKDIQNAFRKQHIEAVMHFAAMCLVNESMEKPELYFENNALGTLNLLEVMREEGVKKVIFSSTCAVYGNSMYLPVDENHPTMPENPYGQSKLMAEDIIKWFGKIHGIKYAILRYFNVCGADSEGEIGDSKRPSELLVQNAVRGALEIQDFKLTCPQVDTRDGTPVRDYVDVEDLVEAHIKALEYLESGESTTFNIGNGKGFSVQEIIQAVHQETGKSFKVEAGAVRKGEYAEIYADTKKIEKLLDWYPRKSLKDSISSLTKWYKNKPNGYEVTIADKVASVIIDPINI